MTEEDLQSYFSGEKLWGDDFSEDQVRAWFEDERQAYFELTGLEGSSQDAYGYGAFNQLHLFDHLPRDGGFGKVLSVGGASGQELLPILDRTSELVVLEPGQGFHTDSVGGKPASYFSPRVDGKMDFPDNSFGLVICLGVLHHIANVSRVFGEICRVLAPGGHVLLREPIISLGDWRRPRPGLTPRERGIPARVFDRLVAESPLQVRSRRVCMNEVTYQLQRLLERPVFNSPLMVRLDSLIAALLSWNVAYHPENRWIRLTRNTSVAYVLRKGPGR